MIRMHRQWVIVGLALGVLCNLGCEKRPLPPQPAPAPPKPAEPKGPDLPTSGCATRFAIAQLEPNATSCQTERGANWVLVPPGPDTQVKGDKAKDDKAKGEKAKDDKANADDDDPNVAYGDDLQSKGPDAEMPWQSAPGAAPFCIFAWNGPKRPTPADFASFKKVKAEPECAASL